MPMNISNKNLFVVKYLRTLAKIGNARRTEPKPLWLTSFQLAQMKRTVLFLEHSPKKIAKVLKGLPQQTKMFMLKGFFILV